MKKLWFAALFAALTLPAAGFAADLAGDANFKAKCAMCHGANAEGKAMLKTAPLKDAAGKTDADLTAIITKGKGKMPPYGGKLTPEQIKTLVSEIKALK
jgi:mono/diheme cytochrome c family protein